jgi:hypothetical protein
MFALVCELQNFNVDSSYSIDKDHVNYKTWIWTGYLIYSLLGYNNREQRRGDNLYQLLANSYRVLSALQAGTQTLSDLLLLICRSPSDLSAF